MNVAPKQPTTFADVLLRAVPSFMFSSPPHFALWHWCSWKTPFNYDHAVAKPSSTSSIRDHVATDEEQVRPPFHRGSGSARARARVCACGGHATTVFVELRGASLRRYRATYRFLFCPTPKSQHVRCCFRGGPGFFLICTHLKTYAPLTNNTRYASLQGTGRYRGRNRGRSSAAPSVNDTDSKTTPLLPQVGWLSLMGRTMGGWCNTPAVDTVVTTAHTHTHTLAGPQSADTT